MSLGLVWRAARRGEGIARVIMNARIARTVEMRGVVVDVGGRGGHSYLQSLPYGACQNFYILDLVPDVTVDAAGSITALPLVTASCDVLLCFNVLEHVYDYTTALSEMQRVLKPGGILYGRVPFLMNVHGDPWDYWRYTRHTLEHVLKAAGFGGVAVQTDGGLFMVLLNLLGPIWRRLGILRVPVGLSLLFLDFAFSRLIGSERNREQYPMGYFFTAEID